MHDIVVIGASAGGIEALVQMISKLPGNLPVSLFVVVHFPSHGYSNMPRILERAGHLPAAQVRDGESIHPGMIYVAVPDFHLLLSDGKIQLSSGPREHSFRPAIDPTFRSAAQAYGPRTLGILLSGLLDDGTNGLLEIKRSGGLTIVQDPEEALFNSMPLNAIRYGAADEILPIAEIAKAITLRAKPPKTESEGELMPDHSDSEIEQVKKDIHIFEDGKQPDTSTILTCPECGGVLWEIHDGKLIRYRCHVGHAYSEESMLEEQARKLEAALWSAIRALEERVYLYRRLASFSKDRGALKLEKRYLEQAVVLEKNANLLRDSLQDGKATGSMGELPGNNS